MPGKLYIVATPIGNLDDLTRRAEICLRQVGRVYAEDTRRTRTLLAHLGAVGKPLDRLDAHAREGELARAVAKLLEGEDAALVTDAGTPGVSDPGAALVAAAVAQGITVVPLPGPSAVLAAIAASGFGGSAFRFFGFLPRAGQARAEALASLIAERDIAVVFEASNRLQETLGELAARRPERPAVVARELTKLHEEFVRGTLASLAADERLWRGEISLVLGPDAGAAVGDEPIDDARIDAWLDEAVASGMSAKTAADVVAARSGRPRREVYARAVARKRIAPLRARRAYFFTARGAAERFAAPPYRARSCARSAGPFRAVRARREAPRAPTAPRTPLRFDARARATRTRATPTLRRATWCASRRRRLPSRGFR